MEYNVIVAGVGGQGILTIAGAVARAALRRGLSVKQSEVHGMSQRGGAVQSHVRFADHPVHSELIPLGEADLLIAVEPLEALRYDGQLRPDRGVVVASSVPVRNIPDYPALEDLLGRIARRGPGRHVTLDAAALARAAGSARAENIVMLGAAAAFMPLSPDDLLGAIGELFESKGQRVVELNQLAFRRGCEAAAAQGETGESVPAVGDVIAATARAGRTQLFEHEVYQVLRRGMGLEPPAHRLLRAGERVTEQDLAALPSQRVVLKIVSSRIVHKSDAGGVAVVARSADAVNEQAERMSRAARESGADVEGVLAVEYVDHDPGLGGELLVGLRATREFGPVVAAGLGGVHAEMLARRLGPGAAVAVAPALECAPHEFFRLFARTTAYELVSGRARGSRKVIDDAALLRCFGAFIHLARDFGTSGSSPALLELEVNPFAVVENRLVPLDGRGRIGSLPPPRAPRDAEMVRRLVEPRSIAVIGASATRQNFGRIILNNVRDAGFDVDHLYAIKEGVDRIDGVRCAASLSAVPEPVDLLVAATGAEQVPGIVAQVLTGRARCSSVILISGGVGETEGTQHVHRALRDLIGDARAKDAAAPVFLGPNCMGVRSRPGRYDTFFIPPHKLAPRAHGSAAPAPRRLALVSQSGAFIITRMSARPELEPAVAVSLGNQLDLTVSDVVRAVARRGDIDCVGVYVEGFDDHDGLECARAVRAARDAGKVVVFYKAGRTPAARAAAEGHTASVAGDWDVCDAALTQAGALVATGFAEFEQLLELCTMLHDKRVAGRRVAAVSNAGFEAVGMADALSGARHEVAMPPPSAATRQNLHDVLTAHGLASLVGPRNPLDLTPMATDEAYEQAARTLLEAPEFDAVVVGCVPMTPQLRTTPAELRDDDAAPAGAARGGRGPSIAHRVVALARGSPKPLVFVVDAGPPYDLLAATVRAGGVPVFRSSDQAVAVLGRYLCHRAPAELRPS